MKIHPVGAELLRADMTKLTVAFRNFSDAPKKVSNRLQIENSTKNISLTVK